MENMVFFLAELGLMRYAIVMYCPSMVAASAVYATRCTQRKTPLWSETLKRHTGYAEAQLMECAKLLVNFHSLAAESKLKGVYKKYSSPQNGAVAMLPPAKNLLDHSPSLLIPGFDLWRPTPRVHQSPGDLMDSKVEARRNGHFIAQRHDLLSVGSPNSRRTLYNGLRRFILFSPNSCPLQNVTCVKNHNLFPDM